jgi:tripartite-type tricarboxylate transporter receptor subunit TctC
MERRAFIAILAAALGGQATAQEYPSKPIRTVIPISGGGETNARIVSGKVSEMLGVPLVIEPQTAAGGLQAYSTVARAAPDGYTLLYGISSIVLRQFLVKDVPYDVLKDFTPVAQLGSTTFGLVSTAALPVDSLADLIQYARANPGRVSYATAGLGTTQHLAGVLLEQMTGISMIHVPYKTESQATTDLIGGRVQLYISTQSTLTPLVNAGKAKMLAIPSARRYDVMPNVPTMAEVLPGYEIPAGFFGYFGPANMPPAVVKKLSDTMLRAANSADVKAKLASVGVSVNTAPAEEFSMAVRRNYEVTARLMKAAGIQPE